MHILHVINNVGIAVPVAGHVLRRHRSDPELCQISGILRRIRRIIHNIFCNRRSRIVRVIHQLERAAAVSVRENVVRRPGRMNPRRRKLKSDPRLPAALIHKRIGKPGHALGNRKRLHASVIVRITLCQNTVRLNNCLVLYFVHVQSDKAFAGLIKDQKLILPVLVKITIVVTERIFRNFAYIITIR